MSRLALFATVALALDEVAWPSNGNFLFTHSTQCSGRGVFEGQDIVGDVISFSANITAEDCCTNCNVNSDCVAWSWKSKQGNLCSLLSSALLTLPSLGAVAGMAIQTTTTTTTTTTTSEHAACDSYDTQGNKGMIGMPIGFKKIVSDEESCCKYCEDTDGCYAWELMFGKWCGLHDNNVMVHHKSKSVIGIKHVLV